MSSAASEPIAKPVDKSEIIKPADKKSFIVQLYIEDFDEPFENYYDGAESLCGIGADLAAAEEIMRSILKWYRDGNKGKTDNTKVDGEVVIREVPINGWINVDDYDVIARENI